VSVEQVYDDEEFAAVYERLCLSARQSFVSFLYLLWPQQEGEAYVIGALHEYLAELVDDVAHGRKGKNQSVSVPPQHGKSRLLAVRAVAWLVGHRPGISIAMTGHFHHLLTDFLKEVKGIIASPEYQRVFGTITPLPKKNRANAVEFSNGAEVQCRSCGSKLTGRRVDWLIVDDPHAGREEADSPSKRKKVHQWFFADCVSRLAPDAATFLISTRWHPEDLHAKVTDEESEKIYKEAGFEDALFQVTNIPAVCNDPENDPLGRAEGEACFPEQRPIEFLNLRRTQYLAAGEENEWWSQYQGDPRPAGGNLADITKINMIDLADVPTDIEWVRGIDPACGKNAGADFTACALCAAKFNEKGIPEAFYLIDMTRFRGAYAKRKGQMEDMLERDHELNNVTRCGIEGVGGFHAVFHETKSRFLGQISINERNFRGDKAMRAQPWFNLIEAGRFYMVRGPWTMDFKQELERFPSGKNDDQIDGVSIAREELTNRAQLLIA